MLFGQIDLPDEVLEAHRAGDLVIFAGAGISKPRPSGLPGFRQLVREIEDASGLTLGRHEPFDAFLGRVEGRKFCVHRQVERRIGRRDSEPNRLHRAIVRLFTTPESVRIVTTNFDRHLTTAASDRSSDVQEFVAAALPPGENFRGIVYLHGVIRSGPESLVLTDIGVAYLTKGFARRFLVELFQANQPGLRRIQPQRHGPELLGEGPATGNAPVPIVAKTDARRWRGLGITPITYLEGSRREIVIAGCLEAWGRETSMRASDHEQEVRGLVRRGPDALDPSSSCHETSVEVCPTSGQRGTARRSVRSSITETRFVRSRFRLPRASNSSAYSSAV